VQEVTRYKAEVDGGVLFDSEREALNFEMLAESGRLLEQKYLPMRHSSSQSPRYIQHDKATILQATEALGNLVFPGLNTDTQARVIEAFRKHTSLSTYCANLQHAMSLFPGRFPRAILKVAERLANTDDDSREWASYYFRRYHEEGAEEAAKEELVDITEGGRP